MPLLSPTSSSSSSSSLVIGDYIGMESGVDLIRQRSDQEDDDDNQNLDFSSPPPRAAAMETDAASIGSGRRRRMSCEFPPPIPSLARTENLPSHMPWVMRRYYSGDGRLVIREEKVRHHEYFKAHRANGRLTLRLVPLDDSVWSSPPSAAVVTGDEFDDIEADQSLSPSSTEVSDCESPSSTETGETSIEPVEEPPVLSRTPPSPMDNCGGGIAVSPSGCGSAGKCIFRMPVLPLRPVHS